MGKVIQLIIGQALVLLANSAVIYLIWNWLVFFWLKWPHGVGPEFFPYITFPNAIALQILVRHLRKPIIFYDTGTKSKVRINF